MSVRVRFAPSPTGNLHVGSARTALFNWLFARREGGQFILRIEDTDRERSNAAYLEDITAGLEFLGMQADEKPVFQSDRIAIYTEQAERLLAEGKAEREGEAVILPVGVDRVRFKDYLRGTIETETELFKRIVLLKSDGMPAYNFACAVDDALMGITHVIRGDDHIANTPKQVVLYEALGFEVPQYVHIPLIVAADRSRLSKRHGATSVSEYRKDGYLSEAFVNYLALLGWSPGGDKELMTREELIELFDLKRIRKTASQFDLRKLEWLNAQHIKRLTPAALAERFAVRLKDAGLIDEVYDARQIERIAALVQSRAKTLSIVESECRFFFIEPPEYDAEAVRKFLQQEALRPRFEAVRDGLSALAGFEPDAIEGVIRSICENGELAAKDLIHPLRVALTGTAVSPPLFEMMSILGKERVLARLEHALEKWIVRQPQANA